MAVAIFVRLAMATDSCALYSYSTAPEASSMTTAARALKSGTAPDPVWTGADAEAFGSGAERVEIVEPGSHTMRRGVPAAMMSEIRRSHSLFTKSGTEKL